MLVVDRTHPIERDLDWAPEQIRRWSPWRREYYPVGPAPAPAEDDDPLFLLAAIPILDVLFMPIWVVSKAAGLVSYFGEVAATDRSATYDDPRERSRLGQLQALPVEIARLAEAPENTLLQVQGRVIAENTIGGVIDRGQGVGRRLVFRTSSGWWMHEALIEFAIEDPGGARVTVNVANARILARLGPPEERVVSAFRRDGVPEAVRSSLRDYVVDNAAIPSAERVLRVGETLTIFGYRSGGDPAGGYRGTPNDVTLVAGELPLLIVPII